MNNDLANIIFTGNQVWLSQKQRIRRKWNMKPIPVGDWKGNGEREKKEK